MSRFSASRRSMLVSAALLPAAGCAGAPGSTTAAVPDGRDLAQALPSPTTPPTTAPTTVPPTTAPSTKRSPGADGDDAARHREAGSSSRGGSGIAWEPVASFDFTESTLDEKVWNPYNSKGGFGTGYRRPEAISVESGKLRITARGDVSGGMGHRYGQTYGRWEFRARTDKGRGFSAAILLWPDSENKDDGELDMMEVPSETRDAAHFVVHWSPQNKIDGAKVPGDFSQWHTFALEWLPDRITWYVDGVKRYENRDKAVIPTKPMHLAIQLDQGPLKDWVPARDETTPEEVSLEVDWVRIYRAPK